MYMTANKWSKEKNKIFDEKFEKNKKRNHIFLCLNYFLEYYEYACKYDNIINKKIII